MPYTRGVGEANLTTALVLIADDHQEIRDLMSLVLEMRTSLPAFEIIGKAADGQEAVDIARKTPPHAAVLDLSMPRMDGLEAAKLLREENPSMVIVIYSGFEASEFAERAAACGANAYVEKSARGLEEVVAQLERLLAVMGSEQADER